MKILNKQRKENKPCPLCNKSNKLVTTFDELNDQPIIDAIQEDRSDWNPEQGVCLKCLDQYHQRIITELMKIDQGEGYTCLLYTSDAADE